MDWFHSLAQEEPRAITKIFAKAGERLGDEVTAAIRSFPCDHTDATPRNKDMSVTPSPAEQREHLAARAYASGQAPRIEEGEQHGRVQW